MTNKKKRRPLRILIYVSLASLVFMSVVGFILRKTWGRDEHKVSIQVSGHSFEAQRDKNGVWEISADSSASLWFAMGYLQSLDREFQLELIRRVSTGKLSEWFGERTLNRDKLMRHFVELGKWDWKTQQSDPLLKEGVESFVAGRNHYLKNTSLPLPFEYRVLGLERKDITALEPWEVMAIARFHTWQFSYDYQEDLDAHVLSQNYSHNLYKILGAQWSPSDNSTLYNQNGIPKSALQISKLKQDQAFPNFVVPEKQNVSYRPSPSLRNEDGISSSNIPFLNLDASIQGASNAWIIGNPDTGLAPTLCNDPHLSLNWPSSLYPIKYNLVKSSKGTGFMLPGVPGLVLGRVHSPDSQLAWGVTLATFADTQDFVRVSKDELTGKTVTSQNETFVIHNRTEKTSSTNKDIPLEWTNWGPRVDQLINIQGLANNEALVFDWMGFRQHPTILKFFLKRSLNAAEDLEKDLLNSFTYPAVNFTWMEKTPKNEVEFGHMVTGWIIERDREKTPQGLVSLNNPRKFSSAKQRPYLKHRYNYQDPFLLVTGNQRIWSGELSDKLAYGYMHPSRTKRLLEQHPNLIKDPSSGQRDAYVPELHRFWKTYRGLLSVDRLCSSGESSEQTQCRSLVAALDSWNGVAKIDTFEPFIIAAVYAPLKFDLWPQIKAESNKEILEAKLRWHKSSHSYEVLHQLLSDAQHRQRWQKERQLKVSFDDFLVDHFHKALLNIRTKLGPSHLHWNWGNAHKISWMHPFTLMPEPLGNLLNESVFGPPRPVPGGFDSPQRFDISWNPKAPLNFPANHGSSLRFCTKFTESPTDTPVLEWANSTGVSGNPFSKWASAFPNATYFRDVLANSQSKK